MRPSGRGARFLAALAVCALAAATFAIKARGQEDQWRVERADYGWRNQRTDVTNLLQDLISRGGVNGRIAVNNQTMGGDPAVGRDKSLRIFARNRRGQEREFDYNEGSSIEVGMFSGRGGDDWDNRGGNYPRDNRDYDDLRDFRIIRGFYGVQGRTANVTDLLRGMVRNGTLTLDVNNSSMGGDPAPGPDKVLIVIYWSQGREQATAVREGHTLSIP